MSLSAPLGVTGIGDKREGRKKALQKAISEMSVQLPDYYESFEALRFINLTLRSGLEREERLAKGCPKAGHWLKEDSQALAGLAVR